MAVRLLKEYLRFNEIQSRLFGIVLLKTGIAVRMLLLLQELLEIESIQFPWSVCYIRFKFLEVDKPVS